MTKSDDGIHGADEAWHRAVTSPQIIIPTIERPRRACRHSSGTCRPTRISSDSYTLSRRTSRAILEEGVASFVAHDSAELSISRERFVGGGGGDVSQLSLSLAREEPEDIDLVDMSMSKVSASFNRALESVRDGVCTPTAAGHSQRDDRRKQIKASHASETTDAEPPSSDSSSSSFADFDCKIVRRPSGELRPDFFCIPISRVERHLDQHSLRAPEGHGIKSFDRRESTPEHGDDPHQSGRGLQSPPELEDMEPIQGEADTGFRDDSLPMSPPLPPRSLLLRSVMRHRARSGRHSLPSAADLASPKQPQPWSSPPAKPPPAARFGYAGPTYGSLSASNVTSLTGPPKTSTPPHSRFAPRYRPASVLDSCSERVASPLLAGAPRRAPMQQHKRSFSSKSIPAHVHANSDFSARLGHRPASPFVESFLSTPRIELEEEIRAGLEDQSVSLSGATSEADAGSSAGGSYAHRGSTSSGSSGSSGSESPPASQGSGQYNGGDFEEAPPLVQVQIKGRVSPLNATAWTPKKKAGGYTRVRARTRTTTPEGWPRASSPLAEAVGVGVVEEYE